MVVSFDHACQALIASGIKQGDVVFSHHNIAFFGKIESCNTLDQLIEFWLQAFKKVLGEDGVLVLPTFTYSFGSDKIEKRFSPKSSLSNTGALGRHLIGQTTALRTYDPMLSVVCTGAKENDGRANELATNISNICFGSDSIWDRLYQNNAIICNLNLDCGSTFLHWVERECNVSYRKDITMAGIIETDHGDKRTEIIYTGRDLNDPSAAPNFTDFHQLCVDKKLTTQISLGRGQINSYRARNIADFLQDTLIDKPLILIQNYRQQNECK